jgi:hypothetical protein
MAESLNSDAAVFGLKVKLRPLLNSWSGLFEQQELNDLFFVIWLRAGDGKAAAAALGSGKGSEENSLVKH